MNYESPNQVTLPNNYWTNPVVTDICKERDEEIKRSVYPMQLSVQSLRIIWEKSRQFKTIFNQDIRGDFNKFCNLFAVEDTNHNFTGTGLFWRVDDFVGIYYLTDITPGFEANAHFTFFDRRLNGRLDLTKKMLVYLFSRYGFQRMNVELPKYVTDAPRNFVKQLGFKPEGRRRKAAWFNDEWYDTNLFGILRSEVLGESQLGSIEN